MRNSSRRQFVKSSIAATFAAGLETSLSRSMLRESALLGETAATVPADSAAIKKGVLLEMLPDKLSYADRFKMAREVGFEVVQAPTTPDRSEEHTSELQSLRHLVCRLLLEKKKT